jgi:hypothetical protein
MPRRQNDFKPVLRRSIETTTPKAVSQPHGTVFSEADVRSTPEHRFFVRRVWGPFNLDSHAPQPYLARSVMITSWPDSVSVWFAPTMASNV